MPIPWVLIAGVLALLAGGIALRFCRLPRAAALAGGVFCLAWLIGSLWQGVDDGAVLLASRVPAVVLADGYVGSQACRKCHAREHASWHASYHRTMTQPATPETVVGRFEGHFREPRDGRSVHLERRGDEFWAEMNVIEAGGRTARVERQIVLVTGSHHMQVYWYATGQGRTLGQLPLVYLLDERRWIPRRSAFLKPAIDPHFLETGEWNDETGRWNKSCSRCHTTHPRRRPDDKLNNWDTHVAEFGIACEACHSPGQQHVDQRIRGKSLSADASRSAADVKQPGGSAGSSIPASMIVHPARLSARRTSQVCGQCHSFYFFAFRRGERRADELQLGFRFRPGDDFDETGYRFICRYQPGTDQPVLKQKLLRDRRFLVDRFWSDGMVRVSGREYNGLIESACHQRGELSCLSCHAMHQPPGDVRPLKQWADDQLKPHVDGSRVCLECHDSMRDQIAEHTHHTAGGSGSQCNNCHMPHTTYGLLKAIRSHQIDSPTVAASLQTGRPNACNLCHLDKTLSWTAGHLNQWYGHPQPTLTEEQQSVAASVLWLLKGDAGQRALLTWGMGWKPAQHASKTEWLAPFVAERLTDPYDAVRIIAYRTLRGLPGFGSFDYDFLAPADEREAAAKRAIEIWQSTVPKPNRPVSDQILIGPDGRLDIPRLKQLAAEADHRKVDLQE